MYVVAIGYASTIPTSTTTATGLANGLVIRRASRYRAPTTGAAGSPSPCMMNGGLCGGQAYATPMWMAQASWAIHMGPGVLVILLGLGLIGM